LTSCSPRGHMIERSRAVFRIAGATPMAGQRGTLRAVGRRRRSSSTRERTMFFDSWQDLARIVIVGVIAYVALVGVLRISGNRTLSKMNAFDLVVTVALGSTLATILLSKDVALLEGMAAFMLLVGLQFVVTWLSVRSPTFSRIVKTEPTLLLYRGQFLPDQMRRARVVDAEVLAAVRAQGIASIGQVEAVVLETDGTFAVVRSSDEPATALAGVTKAASAKSERERSQAGTSIT
jgi:uncharacterized membrane protein YcaP (DUF421 family)